MALNQAIKHSAQEEFQWSTKSVESLFETPLLDLIFQAQSTHRLYFDHQKIQKSTLMSIKTGNCSEDCKYCSQSARYQTDLSPQPLALKKDIIDRAKKAKENGADRFCMGAAWRHTKEKDLAIILDTISEVKSLGLETCATLGELKEDQAEKLFNAGLDYYNHNLDTAESHYKNVVTTHSYSSRLETLKKARTAGLKLCCGGILGLGESRKQRAALISELANMAPPPESVPINQLVPIAGTPFEDNEKIDPLEIIRTIACARITMPRSTVRLSAGRESMSDELQTLCFFAGANSIFFGSKLLTTPGAKETSDLALLKRLGLS